MQTEAIMGLALRRLTSTEDSKLKQEQAELQKQIEDLQALLGNQDAIEATVAREAGELAKSIGDERKSEVNRRYVCMCVSCSRTFCSPQHGAFFAIKLQHEADLQEQ